MYRHSVVSSNAFSAALDASFINGFRNRFTAGKNTPFENKLFYIFFSTFYNSEVNVMQLRIKSSEWIKYKI